MLENIVYAIEDVDSLNRVCFDTLNIGDIFTIRGFEEQEDQLYMKVSNANGVNAILLDKNISGIGEFSPNTEVISRKCVLTVF